MSPQSPRTLVVAVLALTSALGLTSPGVPTASPVRVAGHRRFIDHFDVRTFQRGNVHTHSTRSDGHSSPGEVASWYRDHGYQFLALTDHELRVDPDDLRELQRPGFIMVAGEEITSAAGATPVHVNAICSTSTISGGLYANRESALAAAVAETRAQHAAAIVNHPNYEWALDADTIHRALSGSYGLEIWSGHPLVHTAGDVDHPSHESIWDSLLTQGDSVTGLAVDDEHDLDAEHPSMASLPGRGWIATFGGDTTRDSICDAILHGRLYCSSGAELRRIALDRDSLSVWVTDRSAVVEFFGDDGRVLATVTPGSSAPTPYGFEIRYALRGDETYVRARVLVHGRGAAWTQAYRTV